MKKDAATESQATQDEKWPTYTEPALTGLCSLDTQTLYSEAQDTHQEKEKHVQHKHDTKYLPQSLGLTI